jgi:hypothetical protein
MFPSIDMQIKYSRITTLTMMLMFDSALALPLITGDIISQRRMKSQLFSLAETQRSLEISFFDIVMDLRTALATSTQLMPLSCILYSSLMARIADIQR